MLTIGHSTLPVEKFLAILRENSVRTLADIRTIPKSRHNPQFAQENLSRSLADAGIEYRWHRALGGLRHARKDSINTGWRNTNFRGYADYMQTPEFAAAVSELLNASSHDHCDRVRGSRSLALPSLSGCRRSHRPRHCCRGYLLRRSRQKSS